MIPQSKCLWSTTSGEKLRITMYLLLKVHITSLFTLSPQSPWLFREVSFPHSPLPVATHGAAVLSNVTSCILGCTWLAQEWAHDLSLSNHSPFPRLHLATFDYSQDEELMQAWPVLFPGNLGRKLTSQCFSSAGSCKQWSSEACNHYISHQDHCRGEGD